MTDAGDLHPYDGHERRYDHDDADPERRARGRELVARVLGLPEPPEADGLRYGLSFYSGGIGVLDRLHIAMRCTAEEAEAIATRAGLVAPETMQADDAMREELEWLVEDDEHPDRSLADALAAFIDEQRVAFQPPPAAGARVWLAPASDVNTWTLVYAVDGELAFIAYDQG